MGRRRRRGEGGEEEEEYVREEKDRMCVGAWGTVLLCVR